AAGRPAPDLLLVNAPLDGWGLAGGVYPSLSSLALGSFLGGQGLDVALLDPTVELVGDQEGGGRESGSREGRRPPDPVAVLEATARRVAELRPRLLGITTMGVVEGRFAVALARRVRTLLPELPVALGGSWAAGAGPQVLARFPWIDAVARGPAEHALAALLSAPAAPAAPTRPGPAGRAAWFSGHPGWFVRLAAGAHTSSLAAGEVLDTGPPPPLRPGQSPPLDLGLLAHPERYDTMVYVSARGCPFACRFCSEAFLFPGWMDEPLSKVAADLAAFAARLPASYLWLCDPLFGASSRRLAELLPLLSAGRTNFLFESRVDTLRPADLPAIRRAGGDLVYLGLEAVSDRSLVEIGKVRSPAAAARYREKAQALVAACAASDVLPVLGVLVPVPGDRPAELQQTLSFLVELGRLAEAEARRAGTGISPFFHAFPYRVDPGTVAWRDFPRQAATLGTTLSGDGEDPLEERNVRDASRELGRDAAAAFRDAVRGLNRPAPALLRRVLRSVPRPYLATEWG
ncbi:MAG: radical SAM protein, partial [Deltaproteobacteria bacterium]|nr:radical SAM protein [Deltaproteobacteria bacterium]